MRDRAASTTLRSMFLALAAVAPVVVLSAGCGGGEPAEPPTPQAAMRAADPTAASGDGQRAESA